MSKLFYSNTVYSTICRVCGVLHPSHLLTYVLRTNVEHSFCSILKTSPDDYLCIYLSISSVNGWGLIMPSEESQKNTWAEERKSEERKKRRLFWKCSYKIREKIKGQKKRKLFYGALMRWHESSALWVLLAWGKPLEQKDRDGRVCVVPQHAHTQTHARRVCITFLAKWHTSSPQFIPAHWIIWPYWLEWLFF